MGSRCASWCLLGAALVFARAATAEDIGREPLLPGQRETHTKPPVEPSFGGAPDGQGWAQPSASGPVDRAGPPQRRWYGWQTLLVDAVPLLGLLGVAAAERHGDEGAQLAVAFSAVYFVGGPIVHMGHGQFGKAALSFGVRSAGPLLILAGSQDGLQYGSSLGDVMIVFGALAIPAAITIDAAAIAREDLPPRAATASILQRLGFAPWFDPKHGGAGLSVDLSL
jgi:hypothetical protein